MDDDNETYILLLLSDSNLPTGSFVASSGLESYVKHGFSSSSDSSTVTFIQNSLMAYGRNALPFVSDAHRVVSQFASSVGDHHVSGEESQSRAVIDLTALDELYEAITLNHVARRASKSQGVALLTLYTKSFSRPPSVSGTRANTYEPITQLGNLLDGFKALVRKEEVPGHLPICWGALTGALGLSLERSQYLHLFLHARSLLSASVRLNNIGPYHAQQLLMHVIRPLIAVEASKCKNLRTGLLENHETVFDEINQGPANTWPLGEIVATRHDLQHSRVFNS